ncbi:MAG: hypothetical protein V2I33_01115, partial [Kangiellaceae bacterium]|nr:hypothetical protein [Kangiellaceae bacterium]
IGGVTCANPGVDPCQAPFSVGPESVDSGKEWFLIPGFGYSTKLSDTSAFGLAVYGNGGMNTHYRGGTATVLNPQNNTMTEFPGTFGAGTAGVDLTQLFINATYAWQASENLDVGISGILAYQRFEATGLANFQNISLDSTALSNEGYSTSTGFGLKFGVNYQASDALALAFSYQSKFSMGEFDEYAGLFAEQGAFDLPSTYTVGFAWDTSETSTLLLDYQVINYTDVASISNSVTNVFTCSDALNNTINAGNVPSPATGTGCLGGANGAGFGWDDMSVIKLGYEWASDDTTYRVGYSTGDQPIGSSEVNFNILAPGVVENHITFGWTTKDENNEEMTVFIMYAPETKVSGTSLFDQSQTIEIKMDQLEIGVSFTL